MNLKLGIKSNISKLTLMSNKWILLRKMAQKIDMQGIVRTKILLIFQLFSKSRYLTHCMEHNKRFHKYPTFSIMKQTSYHIRI